MEKNTGLVFVDHDDGLGLRVVACRLDSRGVAQGVITTPEEKIAIINAMITDVERQIALEAEDENR